MTTNTNTTTKTNAEEIARIQGCLDYIAANPVPARLAEVAWRREVEAEARAAGLLPALASRIGCNVPARCFAGEYGGDMVDAF
jgi:hypothetical protein